MRKFPKVHRVTVPLYPVRGLYARGKARRLTDPEPTVPRYPCVVCTKPLNPYPNSRSIPDYLCLGCYREWSDQLDQPWLKKLCNMERSRRLKIQRYKQRGIVINEISLEQLIKEDSDGFVAPSI